MSDNNDNWIKAIALAAIAGIVAVAKYGIAGLNKENIMSDGNNQENNYIDSSSSSNDDYKDV